MTDELFERAPDDVEELIVEWLSPLGPAFVVRRPGDTLPFRRVAHIAGYENPQLELAEAVVSVHTLCRKADGWRAAKDEAADTHRRMLELAKNLDTIELFDRDADVDYVTVFQSPIWTPYEDDQIVQKTGRYAIGLSYVPVAQAGS